MIFTVGLPASRLTAAAASSQTLDAKQAGGSRVLIITVPQRVRAVQFKEYMDAIDETQTGGRILRRTRRVCGDKGKHCHFECRLCGKNLS